MKKIFVIVIIAALSTLGFSNPDPGDGKRQMRDRIIEKLNLNEDQLQNFNDYHYKHQKEVIELQAEIEKNRLEINKMMLDNNIDKAALLELTGANSELRAKIHQSKISMWLNIYEILNDDQKEIWTQHFVHMDKGNRHFNREGEMIPGGMKNERNMHRGMMDRDRIHRNW